MVLIDSNIWIALIDEDDALHERAKKVISKITETVIMPYTVASEVATVLTYKLNKEAANAFLETVINNQEIILVENDQVKETLYFLEFEKRLSFADYALIALVKNNPYKLITFDKQLDRFYKSLK